MLAACSFGSHSSEREYLLNTLSIVRPLGGLRREPLFAGRSELVPLPSAAGRVFPRTANEFLFFQPVEKGIHRAGLQIDARAASFADLFLDQVTVFLAPRQDRENHQVQTAAEQIFLKLVLHRNCTPCVAALCIAWRYIGCQ